MRFSLRVNNDLSPGQLLAVAEQAEAAGADQLWVSNDLLLRSAPVLAATVAAHTERLRLGIAVLNPYSVHPTELAMIAATLQEVSGGRFLLGIGAGSEEFLGWAGIRRDRPLATTTGAVAALRKMLGHSDVREEDLPGWWSEQAVLKVPLTVPVPVYVGAMGPRMLAMAGRSADGALPLLYPPEHYPVARAQVQVGLSSAGRDPAEFDLPACFWVSVSDDAAAARLALAEKLAYYGPSIAAQLLAEVGLTAADFAEASILAHRGEGDLAADLVDPRALDLGIAGDAKEVLRRCRGLIAMGAEHLSFGPPLGRDPAAAVRILGADVLPELREGTAQVRSAGR